MNRGQRKPIGERLAAYFRAQSEWHDWKAEEYPDDARNERCAEALLELADYVGSLGHADPRLLVLDALDWGPDDVYAPCQENAYLVASFCFHSPTESYDEFLTRFAETEERGHFRVAAGGE